MSALVLTAATTAVLGAVAARQSLLLKQQRKECARLKELAELNQKLASIHQESYEKLQKVFFEQSDLARETVKIAEKQAVEISALRGELDYLRECQNDDVEEEDEFGLKRSTGKKKWHR